MCFTRLVCSYFGHYSYVIFVKLRAMIVCLKLLKHAISDDLYSRSKLQNGCEIKKIIFDVISGSNHNCSLKAFMIYNHVTLHDFGPRSGSLVTVCFMCFGFFLPTTLCYSSLFPTMVIQCYCVCIFVKK